MPMDGRWLSGEALVAIGRSTGWGRLRRTWNGIRRWVGSQQLGHAGVRRAMLEPLSEVYVPCLVAELGLGRGK
jgi:hypothetical protein